MILTPLYHWSPAARYLSILAEGLRPGKPSVTASEPLSYLCFGITPQRAWSISGAMGWTSEVESWDCWMAHLTEAEEVNVRPEFGPQIDEVMIRGQIPPQRLWWVGRRTHTGGPVGHG